MIFRYTPFQPAAVATANRMRAAATGGQLLYHSNTYLLYTSRCNSCLCLHYLLFILHLILINKLELTLCFMRDKMWDVFVFKINDMQVLNCQLGGTSLERIESDFMTIENNSKIISIV